MKKIIPIVFCLSILPIYASDKPKEETENEYYTLEDMAENIGVEKVYRQDSLGTILFGKLFGTCLGKKKPVLQRPPKLHAKAGSKVKEDKKIKKEK